MARAFLLVSALLVWLAPVLVGQTPAPMPMDSTALANKSDAGVFLVHWAAEDGSRSEQVIYMRNISKDQRIRIDWWEVYDCQNLRGKVCGRHEGGPELKPGQTVKLTNVSQGNRRQAYSYRYRFYASWVRDTVP